MCQLTWRWKIRYSDAFHRDDASSWRERSSIFMINSALYYRGSVRGAGRAEIWLKTMMQFNATLQKAPLQTLRWNAILARSRVRVCLCASRKKETKREASHTTPAKRQTCSRFSWGMRRERERGEKKKKNVNRENAQISARWASSLCVCIHINIQTGLPESRAEQRLFLGEGWEKKKEKRIRGGFWVQLRREAVLFFIFYFFGEVLSVERYEIFQRQAHYTSWIWTSS